MHHAMAVHAQSSYHARLPFQATLEALTTGRVLAGSPRRRGPGSFTKQAIDKKPSTHVPEELETSSCPCAEYLNCSEAGKMSAEAVQKSSNGKLSYSSMFIKPCHKQRVNPCFHLCVATRTLYVRSVWCVLMPQRSLTDPIIRCLTEAPGG